MPREGICLKRDELYEQVWSQPLIELAKQFGLSDVGLAKICRKLKIPLPGRGYWAKHKAGESHRVTHCRRSRKTTSPRSSSPSPNCRSQNHRPSRKPSA